MEGGWRALTLLCCAIALALASTATAGVPEGPTTPRGGPGPGARSPTAQTIGAGSACALLEGLPASSHPLRKHASLRPLLGALDAAGQDRRKNLKVFERMQGFLEPLFAQAEKVFARPEPAGAPAEPFKPQPARAFLERWVFAPNAPLRVGRDRIEPVPELASGLMLAACRGGRGDDAIRIGRTLSGPEASAQRAFAALLLVEAGRSDEARELLPELGEEGFLAPFVAAELAAGGGRAERERLHALAGRHIQTPDQDAAWRIQARRFEAMP